MASLEEQVTAAENATLRIKVRAALSVSAEAIRVESGATTNHANRLKFAKVVNFDREKYVIPFLTAAIAQNASSSFAQIVGASDAAIQTAVNNLIDVFADGT